MQNEEGQNMDLYIPRKCSATNRLITSKDHASVQINVGHVDENGIYTGQFSTFALCGFIRAQGDGDSALDRLWQKKKFGGPRATETNVSLSKHGWQRPLKSAVGIPLLASNREVHINKTLVQVHTIQVIQWQKPPITEVKLNIIVAVSVTCIDGFREMIWVIYSMLEKGYLATIYGECIPG
ncbi:hypothetical protein ACFE04_027589 [Oxalis oulophora]